MPTTTHLNTLACCYSPALAATMESGHACEEPTLRELLADPMVKLVMERDGVTERDVEDAFPACAVSL